MRTASTYVLGIVCLLIHAAGCGSDPSPSGSSTTGAAGGGTATSTGTGGSTATSTGTGGTGGGGTCVAPTGGCGAPDQCGPIAPAVQIMQALPAGLGGVVEDGTYWVTSFNLYTGPGSAPVDLSGTAFGGTFVLGGGMLHLSVVAQATAGSPPTANGESGTFVTSAKTFTMDLTCGDKIGTTNGSYTVSGKTLSLYIPTNGGLGTELVLTKQ
jgi:hypothetical protein